MEKDIEILEEILNRQIEDTEGTKIMKQAIENLINRVKELEEIEEEYRKENGKLREELKEINEEYGAEQKHEMQNTIPKSKIKAKMEEVDNYGDTESLSPPYYITKKGAEIFKADAELILEELLEEEDK